jgi:hypothetical protein
MRSVPFNRQPGLCAVHSGSTGQPKGCWLNTASFSITFRALPSGWNCRQGQLCYRFHFAADLGNTVIFQLCAAVVYIHTHERATDFDALADFSTL